MSISVSKYQNTISNSTSDSGCKSYYKGNNDIRNNITEGSGDKVALFEDILQNRSTKKKILLFLPEHRTTESLLHVMNEVLLQIKQQQKQNKGPQNHYEFRNNNNYEMRVSPNSSFQVPGYKLFKPRYWTYATLKPKSDLKISGDDAEEEKDVKGRIVILEDEIQLQAIDSLLEEGRTLYRIQVTATRAEQDEEQFPITDKTGCDPNRKSSNIASKPWLYKNNFYSSETVETYVWNGNSIAGEWEY